MLIALYNRVFELENYPILKSTIEILEQKRVDIIIYAHFYNALIAQGLEFQTPPQIFTKTEDIPDDADCFISLGGDGTILDSVTFIGIKQIPVLGINLGRLGFLATINVELLNDNVEEILKGNYNISKRSLLTVETNADEEIEDSFALNEITVTRRETTSMITVEAHMNGEFLNSFWADGLIISTPTGSTGYSMSCGGPIIHPANRNFIITPIAPHNLNVRPFIISDDSVLKLKIHSRVNEYFLSLDARNIPLSTNIELIIKKADFEIYIVEPKDKSYLMTLREKLLWGSDKRN